MTTSPTFGHRNRQSLLEMMRPPTDYRLGSAIGTSYSADFVTLTSIMLAFVDAEMDEDEKYNVPQQLGAITRLADKMLLFVNRSSTLFSGVKESTKIFAIYDRIFREIHFEDGSFHPKVWLLTYEPRQLPTTVGCKPIYRVLCSSRNVTSTNNWELAIKLEGQIQSRRRTYPFGEALSSYFDRIRGHSQTESAIINSAIDDLPFVDFDMPQRMSGGCEFLFQWPNRRPLYDDMPAGGKRALIVSPFLSKSFVETALTRFDEVYLISTKRELDTKLNESLVKRLGSRVFFVDDELSGEVNTRMSLHAKLYIFDLDSGSTVMLGSANASFSAWNKKNCEAMLSFSPGWNVRQFLQQFVFADEKKDVLHAWIDRYSVEDWKEQEEQTDEELGDAAIGQAQKLLAGFQFDLNYDDSIEQLVLKATSDSQQEPLADATEEVTISVMPISLVNADDFGHWGGGTLLDAFGPGIAYRVHISQLSEFVCFQIAHASVKSPKRFILKATSHNFADLLDTRDTELLRSQLTAKQFAQFLNAVLFDSSLHGQRTIETLITGHKGRVPTSGQREFSVCIEDVMRACTEDETRVEEVSKILATFHGADAKENEYVSQDFREFWSEFTIAFENAVRV